MKKLILILINLLIIIQFAFGQIKSKAEKNLWGTIAGGRSNIGLGASFSLNFRLNKNVFTIQFQGAEEFAILDKKLESIEETSLLYGRLFQLGNTSLIISTGISSIYGMKKFQYLHQNYTYLDDYKEFTAIGLPIKLHYSIFSNSSFGLGLEGFANLNKERSACGASLVLRIGRIKK